jgi:predicted  nucleic acid-binding Zn-ribbon protein
MRRFSLFFAVFGIVAAAPAGWAQEGGASVSSGPMVITISKPDCSRLVRYVPSADVAYKPGVDVHGRPVVSADADPKQAEFAKKILPEVLEIPITINPLTYNKAKAANKKKADAATAVSANTAAIDSAKAKGTTLNGRLTTLNGQKTALTATYNSDKAAIIAATGGAGQTDPGILKVRSARISALDGAYNTKVSSINSQISDVNAAITANTADLTALQAKDTTLRQAYSDTNMATEGTLAGLSAKGLDSTQARLGVVKYDINRNTFTFNDEPMTSEDQRALAEACARRGVR